MEGASSGINRFSSRTTRLHKDFLRDRLKGAASYDRIAGYFRSSFFELAREEIPTIGRVRIVCNADLDPRDITAANLAQSARERALMGSWHSQGEMHGAVIEKGRWQQLYEMLTAGNVEIRVVSRDDAPFLHGKAGLITAQDGSTSAFVGSVNETAAGWRHSYEIIWEDRSPEAAVWVAQEFDWLWERGVPLPRAVIDEIYRLSRRVEVTIPEVRGDPMALAKAMVVEAPMRISGDSLQPWQKAFVRIWTEHRERYGSARLLLADEVGVGKTLSMAVTGALSCMLGDGPLLILCPATLTRQWQQEMLDNLGLPSCRWASTKGWVDANDVIMGQKNILCCPTQIGIVSTGLLTTRKNDKMPKDVQRLLTGDFGMIILDEGHKARITKGLNGRHEESNLYQAMEIFGKKCRHLVIGTATPIQIRPEEIWDTMRILALENEHVLGTSHSRWQDARFSLDLIRGRRTVKEPETIWDLVRNPLPHGAEHPLFGDIRHDLNLSGKREWITSSPLVNMDSGLRDELILSTCPVSRSGNLPLLRYHNPLGRHVVLRRRKALEKAGLMDPVDVKLWPDAHLTDPLLFIGSALITPPEYQVAYYEISNAIRIMAGRSKSVFLLRKLVQQRICSSVEAGILTIKRMIEGRDAVISADYDSDEEEENAVKLADDLNGENLHLRKALESLEKVRDLGDPKLAAVRWFLEDREWMDKGCIVFSQYHDTARWIASELSCTFEHEMIAVYAGSGKSGLFRNGEWTSVDRDVIKRMVADREIRLVCATEAACEGLNLQTLGTLINVDLPWNPSRLQQRIGRIKRMGQRRRTVDMASLVYEGTVDQEVYERLSKRLRENFEILGSLPDTIIDDWIKDKEKAACDLEELTDPSKMITPELFKLRYGDFLSEENDDWDRFERAISTDEMEKLMRRPWEMTQARS